MLLMASLTPVVAAVGYSLVYLLAGGGLSGMKRVGEKPFWRFGRIQRAQLSGRWTVCVFAYVKRRLQAP